MGLMSWINGYYEVREIQAVFSENGKRGPAHAVTKYYTSDGKYFKTEFGGKLTAQEKRICEDNLNFIKSSPFSWVSSGELDLPLAFAEDSRVIMKGDLSEKLD